VNVLPAKIGLFCRPYSPPSAAAGELIYRMAIPWRIMSSKVIMPKKLLISVSTDTLTTSLTAEYFLFASLSKSEYVAPPKGIPKKYVVVPMKKTDPKILYLSPEGKDLFSIEGYETQAIRNRLIKKSAIHLNFMTNSFCFIKPIHYTTKIGLFCRPYSPPSAAAGGRSVYRIAVPLSFMVITVKTPKRVKNSSSTDILIISSTRPYFSFPAESKSLNSMPPYPANPYKITIGFSVATGPSVSYLPAGGKTLSCILGYLTDIHPETKTAASNANTANFFIKYPRISILADYTTEAQVC